MGLHVRSRLQKALVRQWCRVAGRDHVGSESGWGKGNDAKESEFGGKEGETLIVQGQERKGSREKERCDNKNGAIFRLLQLLWVELCPP